MTEPRALPLQFSGSDIENYKSLSTILRQADRQNCYIKFKEISEKYSMPDKIYPLWVSACQNVNGDLSHEKLPSTLNHQPSSHTKGEKPRTDDIQIKILYGSNISSLRGVAMTKLIF